MRTCKNARWRPIRSARQEDLLLEPEVKLLFALPVGKERARHLTCALLGCAAKSPCDHEGVAVVAGERDQRGMALHESEWPTAKRANMSGATSRGRCAGRALVWRRERESAVASTKRTRPPHHVLNPAATTGNHGYRAVARHAPIPANLQHFSGSPRAWSASLKIVVSPVRVRVSPFRPFPAREGASSLGLEFPALYPESAGP